MSFSSNFTNTDPAATSSDFVVSATRLRSQSTNSSSEHVDLDQVGREEFVERRRPQPYQISATGLNTRERRQFASTHAELSDDGRELATAIDRYKLQHHRRYITCDEMLQVLHDLGYERVTELK